LTQHEFLSALCGEDPDVAAGEDPEDWTIERHRAARFVEAASRAGELTLEYWHAATADEPYGNYDVQRDAAIRWAAARRDLFPKFREERHAADDAPAVASREAAPIRSPTKWADIELHFLSDQTLQVVLNGKHQAPQNYAEMRFEDGRTGKPTKAWETLLDVARTDGRLKVDRSGVGYPIQQKRVEEIRRVLRGRFLLTEDPLPLDKDEDNYRARFKVTRAAAFGDDR
jgi:hypothetical protein